MSTPYADDDPFVAPASGGSLRPLNGRLLLIYPLEQGKSKSDFPTTDGSGMVTHVVGKVVTLDGDANVEAGTVYERMTMKSGSMVPQLLPYVGTGKPVLGRLTMKKLPRGEGWVLDEASAPDMDVARKWIAEHPITKPADPFATVG